MTLYLARFSTSVCVHISQWQKWHKQSKPKTNFVSFILKICLFCFVWFSYVRSFVRFCSVHTTTLNVNGRRATPDSFDRLNLDSTTTNRPTGWQHNNISTPTSRQTIVWLAGCERECAAVQQQLQMNKLSLLRQFGQTTKRYSSENVVGRAPEYFFSIN